MRSRSLRSPTVDAATAGGKPAAPLLGIVDGPRFPDDRDLDLTGVLELVFDSSRDVLGKPDSLFVGNFLAFDHDADFAAGLQCEGLRHALERVGDPLELFEPLHVRLEDVAPGAWA